MLSPVNGHIIIEPIKHEAFIASQRDTYQEVGIVLAVAKEVVDIPIGCKAYFDSWLAKKYPVTGGEAEEFHWVVDSKDVVAIEA